MEIKRLAPEEVKRLYDTNMQRDFPPSELRPYSSISSLTESGNYLCFGCMDGAGVAAYAAFAVTSGAAPAALLDYYAVDESRRGQGVGGRFLSGLRELSPQFGAPYILIEVESVESAETPEQVEERERRIRFYEHCGCEKTDVYSLLFGVEYRILYLPLGDARPADEEVKASLEQVYRLIVPPLAGGTEEAFRRVCRCGFGPFPGTVRKI